MACHMPSAYFYRLLDTIGWCFFLVQTTIQRDINLCCRPYNLAIKLPLSVAGEIVAQKKGRRWATIQTQLELSLSCGGAVMPSTRAFQ